MSEPRITSVVALVLFFAGVAVIGYAVVTALDPAVRWLAFGVVVAECGMAWGER